MKKWISSFLFALCLTVDACWFGIDGQIGGYFAGINNYVPLVGEGFLSGQSVLITNNQRVSLPITCWIELNNMKFSTTTLYYKVIPANGSESQCSWRIAHTRSYQYMTQGKVKLFGNATITKQMIEENGGSILTGASIIMVWYAENENGVSNIPMIEAGSIYPLFGNGIANSISGTYMNFLSNNLNYTGTNFDGTDTTTDSYPKIYVMKVIYNGRTTKNR